MSRTERRLKAKLSQSLALSRSIDLAIVPREEWPATATRQKQVWVSRKYLVQLFDEATQHPELVRLTISRVTLNAQGDWDEELSWQELADIKREVGFGDWYGLEIYPRDADTVNVANMRHLWLMPTPLSIGWFSNEQAVEARA